MIERLYGVEHSVMFSSLFSTEEKSVCPSEELVGKLSALPAGTVVGIEFSLEAHRSSDKVRLNDESEIMVSPASKYYWRRLIDFCGRHKLRVVYLDDFETFEKVMEKRAEAETYKQRLRSFFERLESERSIYTETNYVREWMEAGYRADVEAEYIWV